MRTVGGVGRGVEGERIKAGEKTRREPGNVDLSEVHDPQPRHGHVLIADTASLMSAVDCHRDQDEVYWMLALGSGAAMGIPLLRIVGLVPECRRVRLQASGRRGSFFFFQAEDGIRGGHVTGVQTCALLLVGAAAEAAGSAATAGA